LNPQDDFKDNKKYALVIAVKYFIFHCLGWTTLIIVAVNFPKLSTYQEYTSWTTYAILLIILFKTRNKYYSLKSFLDIFTIIDSYKERENNKGLLKSKINEFNRKIETQKIKFDLIKNFSPIPIAISIITFYLGTKENELPSFNSPKSIFIGIILILLLAYFLWIYKTWRRYSILQRCIGQYQQAYDEQYEN
jgi:hypothetical protein